MVRQPRGSRPGMDGHPPQRPDTEVGLARIWENQMHQLLRLTLGYSKVISFYVGFRPVRLLWSVNEPLSDWVSERIGFAGIVRRAQALRSELRGLPQTGNPG